MYSGMPLHNSPAASSFRAVHDRFRRVRWCLLFAALALFAIWQIADDLIMKYFNVVLDDRIVDWSMAALIGLSSTLGLCRWESRRLAHMEALEERRVATERALVQLEASQATARTVAHNINQPLAVISGIVELYRATPAAERDDADLTLILAQVDQAAGLVRQLLEISRYHTIPYPGGAPMLDLSPPNQTG